MLLQDTVWVAVMGGKVSGQEARTERLPVFVILVMKTQFGQQTVVTIEKENVNWVVV